MFWENTIAALDFRWIETNAAFKLTFAVFGVEGINRIHIIAWLLKLTLLLLWIPTPRRATAIHIAALLSWTWISFYKLCYKYFLLWSSPPCQCFITVIFVISWSMWDPCAKRCKMHFIEPDFQEWLTEFHANYGYWLLIVNDQKKKK